MSVKLQFTTISQNIFHQYGRVWTSTAALSQRAGAVLQAYKNALVVCLFICNWS